MFKLVDNRKHKVNVLIVDDKIENLFALEKMLAGDDRVFHKATSWKIGLKLLLNKEIALILLDVQMPDLDGFEVANLLKSNPKTKNIPILFVTAISKEARYVIQGYDSGGVDYLFKPLDVDITRAKVNTFIRLYKQQRGLHVKNEELENLSSLVNNSLNVTYIDSFSYEIPNEYQPNTFYERTYERIKDVFVSIFNEPTETASIY